MGRNVSYECTAECVNQGPIVIHYCSTQHHDKDTDKPRDHVYKMKWNKWYDPFSKRKIICISNDPPAPNNITYDYYGPCHGKPVGTVLFNSNAVENLNIMEYKTISTWEYLKSSKAITYDENGQNPSTVATYYEYGNPIHMQATAISTTFENASTGTQRATYTKRSFLPDYNFPDNLTGTAAVLNNMGDQHIWNVPIEELNYTLIGSSSRLISGSLNTFKMNGKCVVKDKEYSIKNNNSTVYQDLVVATPATINSAGTFVFDPHYEQANSFDVYDANNNLIQLTDRKNKSAFIREPNTGNVWAQVTNSSYDDIAYSSFEHKAYSFTNWYYKSTGITTASAQSGQNALDLGKSFIASTKTLSASQKYKLSFWKNVNTGAFSVLAGSQNLTPRSGPIRNGWQYFECIFTSATRVQITGTATIDEVRLCPESARMTTYLFKDGVGVISQCNENNQNTFWEYDEFNRLKLVRDQDGFILNKNEYKYQQAQ